MRRSLATVPSGASLSSEFVVRLIESVDSHAVGLVELPCVPMIAFVDRRRTSIQKHETSAPPPALSEKSTWRSTADAVRPAGASGATSNSRYRLVDQAFESRPV